jgi:hypothetical protein
MPLAAEFALAPREQFPFCCVAAWRFVAPRFFIRREKHALNDVVLAFPINPLETIANGKPMDKEKSVHEPMVERRQQGCQSGAGPSQGGSDKATVGASRANSSLLDQHLADPHQAQATAVKRDCRVDIAA